MFQPNSTDVSGAVLEPLTTNHIHYNNRKNSVAGTAQLINAGLGQAYRVAPMPTYSQTNIYHPIPLRQLPFFVLSPADMEGRRSAKRRKTMQEWNAHSNVPADPKLAAARVSPETTMPAAETSEVDTAKENNKATRCTGILMPSQASATSTSPVHSNTSESRPQVIRDDRRLKAQLKSRLRQATRKSTTSVMSLSNLVPTSTHWLEIPVQALCKGSPGGRLDYSTKACDFNSYLTTLKPSFAPAKPKVANRNLAGSSQCMHELNSG